MQLPLAGRHFRGSLLGAPGRRETLKIAIFSRRGHEIHEKLQKTVPGAPKTTPEAPKTSEKIQTCIKLKLP